jgi:hypothetical protein
MTSTAGFRRPDCIAVTYAAENTAGVEPSLAFPGLKCWNTSR